MDTEVSSALSTLELDPQNKDARAAISRHVDPDSEERDKLASALAAARAFHAERGNAELCLELLDRELAITLDKRARADLLAEKGRALFNDFARANDAVENLREALELVQGHAAASELLRKVQDEEAEWEKTAQTRLKQAKESAGRLPAAPHHAVAGELYLKYRPGTDDGESHLARAIEIDPRQKRAEQLLERLYRSSHRIGDLANLYDRRVSTAANNEERAQAEVLAAEVALEQGQEDVALDRYKKALVASAAEPRALHRVIANLASEENWPELAKTYENALRVTKRGPGELAILVPLATVTWRKLDNLDQAELYFRRIRKAEPTHPALMEFYRDYHTRRGEIPQLLALFAQTQKAEPDPEKRIRIGIEMAELAEQRPQSAEKAIDIWKGLLRMQPGLGEAVTALRRLYTKTEKWNALLEMLKDDLEALPKDAIDEKIARYLEMIPIYRDRLRLDVMVTNTFAAILTLRPDHPEALRALAERHEGHGRWADLIDVLQRQAGIAPDPAEKVRLYHRVASLWSDKLAKQQNAVGALEKILEIDPAEETARRRLREIYTRGRSWRPLLDLMRRELKLLPRRQHPAHLKAMADIAADKLGSPREAIGAWNEVLELVPRDPSALTALAKLYEKEGRWAPLAEILGRQAAALGEETPAGCQLLERRGLLLLEKLNATDAAETTLAKVHAVEPENGRVLRALREIHAATGNFEALEALYAKRGAWEELYDALTAVAEKASDADTSVRLHGRAAEIAEGELQQPERAVKAHEKILALRPKSRATAQTLMRLYRETERWGRLLSLFEAMLARPQAAGDADADAGNPDETPLNLPERLELLADARRICEEKLGSRTVAFQWCARAYELAPTNAAGLEDLERLAREADEWANFAQLLSKRLHAGDVVESERLDLLRRLLRVYGTRLGKADEARGAAERILALRPDDDEAERALERILEERKEWPGLVAIWRRREARLTDRQKQTDLRFRIARAEEEELDDLPSAARTLRGILENEPRNARAMASLARVAEVTGDMATVAEILRRQIAEGLAPDPMTALLRLAKLEEGPLNNPERARTAYLEALEMDGVSPEAVAGIEGLLAKKVIDDSVVGRLIPYYELTEDYRKWASALDTLAAKADATERIGYLRTLVDLHGGPLSDTVAAFLTATRIFELDPHDAQLRERLLAMATEVDATNDLLAAVSRVLTNVEESGFRRELLAYQAEINEKRPGGSDQAEKVYLEILSLDPLHFGAYRALTRLYRDAERWIDLRKMLEGRQENLPKGKERLTLLWQVAEIDEALLEDREHAIGVLQKITEVDPRDLKAYRSLEKHYTAALRWPELDALLERELRLVSRDEAIELTLRRAEIAHSHLGATSRALDFLEEVASDKPDHLGARKLLEAILPLPEHRQRTAAILEPLYESSSDWARLARVLEAQLEAREGMAASGLLARIAGIEETRLVDPSAALATWRRVLVIEPASLDALGEAERLAAKLGREKELIPLYDELSAKNASSNLGIAAELLTRAARLHVSLLGDREAAIKTWRRILTLDPSNLDTARPAAEALATLYAQIGDFRGFVEILRLQADWSGEDSERADILRRVAEIEEKSLNDRNAAVATYRALLDENPEDLGAMGELERLYEVLGKHRERVDVMRRRLEVATSDEARRAVRFRMAVILERELSDVDEAISTVLGILDESADNVAALEMLASLYDRKGAVNERLEVLDRQLQLAGTKEARAEILRGMAKLLEEPLGRPAEALERWREVLGLAEGDPLALERVEAMVNPPRAAVEAAPVAVVPEPLVLPVAPAPAAAPAPTPHKGRGRKGRRDTQPVAVLAPAPEPVAASPVVVAEPAAPPKPVTPDYEPTDLPLALSAAEVLEPIYERRGEWNKLAGLVKLYIKSTDDARDRMNHRNRLARIQEERLDDKAAALASTGAAILDGLSEPQLSDMLDSFERLTDAVGGDEPKRLLDLYQTIEEDVFSDDVRLRIARAVAQRAETLGDDALATTWHSKVLQRAPDDIEVLTALERLYRRADEKPALLDVLQRRADLLSGNAAVEAPLRLQIGALAVGLNRSDDAIAAYERVMALKPGDEESYAALDRLYTAARQWIDLCGLLDRQLGRGLPSRDAVELHQRLAEIYLGELGEREQALVHLGAALKLDHDHQPAIARLEQLIGDPDAQVAAADLLEPVYVRRNAWPQLVAIDELRLERSEDAERRLALTQRIARVYEEQIEDLEAAFRWYGRLFRETPLERTAQEQLLRLAPKLDRWRDVAGWFSRTLDEESSNSDEVLELVRLAATVADERLGDRDMARRYYRRYVEAQPGDNAAVKLYEDALERWEAWDELRDLLEEHAAHLPSPADRIPTLRRSAILSADKVGDRSRAASTLRSLLDIDQTDARAATDLESLLRADERWGDLREHLLWMLERVAENGGDLNGVAFRLAEIEEQKLDDVGSAVERYGEILERMPRHAGALGALERLLSDRDHRARVAQILEPHFRRTQEWRKLADVLEVSLEGIDDSERRSAVLVEVAGLEERLGRVDKALGARGRAWLEDVTSTENLAALEPLAQAGRLYQQQADILREGTDRADDTVLAGSLWAMIAGLRETRLADVAGAIDAWRQAIEARSDNEDAFLALERLLGQAGRASELAETLEQHLEIVSDGDRRKVLTKRMAVLFEDALRNADKAVEAWRSVLDVDDADEEALDALGRLYVAGGNWRELVEVYQRKIELARDPQSLRYLRFLSARVYEEKLEEPDEAASQLRAVLDAHHGDVDALGMLDRIFTRENQHFELLEVLDLRVASAEGAERDALAYRAAQLVEKELDDQGGAVARYRDILARNAGHEGARQALWAIARGESYRLPAVAALEPVLRAGREWPLLVDLLELRLGAEETAGVRLEILTEIARIQESADGDQRRAFDAWAAAFAEDPREPAAREALERLAEKSGEPARLAEVFEARLDDNLDSDLEQTLAWRLASLYEDKLGNPEKAVEFLRRLTNLPGQEIPALARLEVLLGRLARWRDLEETLDRESDVATDGNAQAGFLSSLGELRFARLDDREGGVRAFRDALERDPNHPRALSALRSHLNDEDLRREIVDVLEPLAEVRGDHAELASLYEVRVALEDSGAEKALWWRRIATLAEENLNDKPRALTALGQSLKEDPSAPDTAQTLERVALEAGQGTKGAQLMEAALGDLAGTSFVELALRAADLYLQGKTPEFDAAAERLYRRVLDEESENAHALEALDGLYRRQEQPQALAKVLEQRGAIEMDADKRRGFLGEAARIHEARGELAAAIAAWQTVREGDQGDGDALTQLARLYEQQGNNTELVAVLEDRARYSDANAERAALFFRIGELRQGPLSDPEGAASAFKEVLDVVPDDRRALLALAALEGERGDFAALEEVLLRRLSVAQGAEKVETLLALASNAEEKLDDSDRAVSYFHQILDTDPRSALAYDRLGKLLEQSERWYDLIELHERKAAAGETVDVVLGARLAIADVWANRLGDDDSARETVEKLRDEHPQHGPTLLALSALYEKAGRLREAAELLEKAAAAAGTAHERAEVHFRRSRVLEAEGGSPEAVEASLRAALEAEPAHAESLRASEARARKAGDNALLVSLLETRALAASPADRKALLSEIAALYRGPVFAPDRAVAALTELAAASPNDVQVQEDLASALQAAGRSDEAETLLSGLADKLAKAKQNKALARVQRGLGAIAEGKGNLAAALTRFEAAYQLDPTQPAVVASLGRLALRQKDAEKARRYFRALLLQTFDEKAAGITKAEVYLALGRLHLEANEAPKARNLFERGLESDPKNTALKEALAALPR
jgi:tetratricopeptide (TPR) repeat protein